MREGNEGAEATYRIGEISRLTGVKAGTIRFYEKCGFIGPVERTANQYRIYNKRHVFRLRVCRLVFGGFVNTRLRRESLKVLEASAAWDRTAYERESGNYLQAVEEDIERAKRAIALCTGQMGRKGTQASEDTRNSEEAQCSEDTRNSEEAQCSEETRNSEEAQCSEETQNSEETQVSEESRYTKKQAAAMTGATPEAIRNWERNGLLGRYEPYQRRAYGQELLNRMYVIRLLLDTGYSMMAIRAFLQAYEEGRPEEAELLLTNPREGGDLCCRADRYLEALLHLREKAVQLKQMGSEMKN